MLTVTKHSDACSVFQCVPHSGSHIAWLQATVPETRCSWPQYSVIVGVVMTSRMITEGQQTTRTSTICSYTSQCGGLRDKMYSDCSSGIEDTCV